MVSDQIKGGLLAVLAVVVMIVMSLIMFTITLWVMDVAADWVFSDSLSANWGVLSAALLTIGSALGGAGVRWEY